jgi:predicted naringenin-chalcone synthase
LSKIISIGTALPSFRHEQDSIREFMDAAYALNETDSRKLRFLYRQSGIKYRYSVIPDYSRESKDWKFYPHSENLEPFPTLEQRMAWYERYAAHLSIEAIRSCIHEKVKESEITHLISISCTGMSAPGLDLQVMELMDVPKNIYRTSVNFMGCYAAIHGMKIADSICKTESHAKVLVFCTELCTLHFQREATEDNIASSLLFGDGAAAILVTSDDDPHKGVYLDGFYSEVVPKGKKDMSWELSSSGFLMKLSGYVPELIQEDIDSLIHNSLNTVNLKKEDITHWCIHPGGKRILEAISKSMNLVKESLAESYEVLSDYGNMSSPTILFVLKQMWPDLMHQKKSKIMGTAFGPGLTMETFIAHT